MARREIETVVDTLQRSFDHITGMEDVPPGYKDSFRIEILGDTVRGTLGYTFDNKPIGRWLEWGTKPHRVEPRNKTVLSWMQDGKRVFSRGHMVGGIRPRFIMKQVAARFAREIRPALEGA